MPSSLSKSNSGEGGHCPTQEYDGLGLWEHPGTSLSQHGPPPQCHYFFDQLWVVAGDDKLGSLSIELKFTFFGWTVLFIVALLRLKSFT